MSILEHELFQNPSPANKETLKNHFFFHKITYTDIVFKLKEA